MARGRCTFKQRDVTRALKAAIAAGVEVQRVEIDNDGKVVLVTGAAKCGAPTVQSCVEGPSDWADAK